MSVDVTRTTRQKPATGRRRNSPARRIAIGSWVAFAMLIVLAVVYILPFVLQEVTSFKTDTEATNSPFGVIETWTIRAYRVLFRNSDFPLWVLNSVIVTVFVTLGRALFDSMSGYALARLRFRGRQTIYLLLIAVMAVPGVVLLIPQFLVINQLHIYDAYPGMILPLLVDAAGVFIMRNFFLSIPVAVEEQGRIDGAGSFRIFWSIVLPMARPALMTILILSFQGSWNELSHFIIATQNPKLTVLTKGVAQLSSGSLGPGNQYPLKLAAAGLMTIPVAVMFFIFSKRIINNSIGAVKDE
jgi:multiple sugar transport system permease protein